MAVVLNITEGWSEQLGPFTLMNNTPSPAVPIDLTGITVVPIIRDPTGAQVTTGGTISIPTPSNGQVFYKPVPADFVWVTIMAQHPQFYTIHWQLTDISGNVLFVPNGEPDQIAVSRK